MEAHQVQLARSFEEEKRLRSEGLGRERTTSDRALVLLKQSLEQLQKDLAKCSTQTDELHQDRCELREELTQILQRLEDLSNDVAGKGRLGHGQTEQIELCSQRLGDFASEAQQLRNAIEAEVAEMARKFESLQGDMVEKEQARALEYTSLTELCAHLERQNEEDRRLRDNMPRKEVQELLAQSVAKMAEENNQHLADLVKKDSATRVDKLFNISQRLEDLEKNTQLQEVQSRLERITEDERRALEEALGREASLRKELSVVFGRLQELKKSTQLQEVQSRLERITEDGQRSLEEALGREAALRKELSVVFGRLQELEKNNQLQEIQNRLERITEDGRKSLKEALGCEAAMRKDLTVLFGQRLEELEKSTQLQEIQNRFEIITEDGRKSLEEALEREAAMRKELSVLFGQRFDGVEESCQRLRDSLQQESSSLSEELQVQLCHQVEVMLNEILQKTENRLSLCEKLTSSISHLLEETSNRTMLCSDVHPTPIQLPASSSALLPRRMPVDMSRLFSQLACFLEELATMGMGAVVYAGAGLWRRLLHTGLQQ